jgi:hypothetical protein
MRYLNFSGTETKNNFSELETKINNLNLSAIETKIIVTYTFTIHFSLMILFKRAILTKDKFAKLPFLIEFGPYLSLLILFAKVYWNFGDDLHYSGLVNALIYFGWYE